MNKKPQDRRKNPRHILDLNISLDFEDIVDKTGEYLIDISGGGLSFYSQVKLKTGSTIEVKIPVLKPVFCAKAIIKWVRQEDSRYMIGAEFKHLRDTFKERMLLQVCHIQQYKKEIYEKQGRKLSGEQAALEWIEKFASEFPQQ